MLAIERRNKTKEIITEKKSITVVELAEMFDVTEETIRRDLKILEEENFLTRTYGGAFIQDGVLNDINLSIRENILVDNKEQIASLCLPHIQNGDSIFIDPSTTALFVANSIKEMRVTVLSNSLKVMDLLSPYKNINLIGIGGTFSSRHMAFFGRNTTLALKEYYVDKAFISCRSVSLEKGITDSSESMAQIRQDIIDRSNEVFLLADHTKFDKASFLHICNLDKIHYLVTDNDLSHEWKEYCQDKKIKILE